VIKWLKTQRGSEVINGAEVEPLEPSEFGGENEIPKVRMSSFANSLGADEDVRDEIKTFEL